ncbi:Alpha/Beta hydrolase protein [Delphinella strobiligena]|nr:Alpha/Beta hydrolase protein [Delphinella strobiligena]
MPVLIANRTSSVLPELWFGIDQERINGGLRASLTSTPHDLTYKCIRTTSTGKPKAFTTSNAIVEPATFSILAAGSEDAVVLTVSNGKADIRSGSPNDCLFILSALPEQWEQFFKQTPLLHDAQVGPTPEDTSTELEQDAITGHYVYLKDFPIWGRCKVFYETSGEGPTRIVFLHTTGSDGRQYHGVLNDERKSFPYSNYWPGQHTNTEDSYVGCVAAFIKKLGLKKPIVCGASMAGQVGLPIAVRADEVGAGGTIPLQGSDYLNMDRQWNNDRSPYVNQSLYMMSPPAPLVDRQPTWHLYSAQAYGIFHGDLDFYFGGWDGRSRMKDIDTQKCPAFMLTGEYDWSNTPSMSQATCDKMCGGKHKAKKGLCHFPATENPKAFVCYLVEAIDHIQNARSSD